MKCPPACIDRQPEQDAGFLALRTAGDRRAGDPLQITGSFSCVSWLLSWRSPLRRYFLWIFRFFGALGAPQFRLHGAGWMT